MAGVAEMVGFLLPGLAIAALAFYLRVFIHLGKTPSGVDTWYFLTYARELRRTRRMPVRLRTYLLQDEEQSYPPLFPIFLALLPESLLDRFYWVVSPFLDCVNLLFLYVVSYKISGSLLAAIVAGLIYALTPQLISETRSLNSRAFGALVLSLAEMALARFVLGGGDEWQWLALAVALATGVFLSHSLTAISFTVANGILTLVLWDPRFLAVALSAPLCAFLLTRGRYARGVLGHLQSARFWRKNKFRRWAHQVKDSPLYGGTGEEPAAAAPISPASRATVRLIGENPFIVSLMAATVWGLLPLTDFTWATVMSVWAIGVFGWAAATTLVRPLRVFGPGYLYIKTSTFATAYTLGGLLIGNQVRLDLGTPAVLILLPAFPASLAALVYFYRYINSRTSEHTATAPPGLQAVARHLSALPGERVACLPTMYADYVSYKSGKQILWGGHSGDPERLDGFYPVITRPLEEFFAQYRIDYFVLDLDYVSVKRLRLDLYLKQLETFDRFAIFSVAVPSPQQEKGHHVASTGPGERQPWVRDVSNDRPS